mgnify:CR=1 FL=1
MSLNLVNSLKTIVVNVCRLILAFTFIFSGYVKAVDPLGTQYKLQEYLESVSLHSFIPSWLVLVIAVLIAAIEFSLGIFALFAVRRRSTSKWLLVIMSIMTVITLAVYFFNPIRDCGCFGDAIKLTTVR